MTDFTPFKSFATDAIHAGQEPEQWASMAVIPPIFLSTTFKQMGPNDYKEFEYTRGGNPTRKVTETCIAALENGKFCSLFASGLAATTAMTQCLSAGDHIVAINDLYGGTNRFFKQIASRGKIESTLIDATVTENVAKAIQPNTKLVWIESPTNPLLRITDIKAVAEIAHNINKDIIVVVDNTFATPYFQRPLNLGADVVLHSLTKYMNGHTDVLMGALISKDQEIAKRIQFIQFGYLLKGTNVANRRDNDICPPYLPLRTVFIMRETIVAASGAVPAPFDCYLVNRGLKTLHLRMREHMRNSLAVAKFLETSPLVEKVVHPGLPSHPHHERAKKQMAGFSGMVTFFIKGGLPAAKTFLQSIKVFILAESLGGYESLAEHPASMTHASVPADERAKLGITDNLIRLSVGLEDEEDLVNDIEQALKASV